MNGSCNFTHISMEHSFIVCLHPLLLVSSLFLFLILGHCRLTLTPSPLLLFMEHDCNTITLIYGFV